MTGVGAGSWLFGAAIGLRSILLLGLAIVLVGGIFHLGFLGRAERFWRMVVRVRTSWISRGLIGVGVFSVFAILYLIASSVTDANGVLSRVMLGLSVLGAVWLCVYKGFVWASAKGVAFWNSALLPAVFIAYAVRGGVAVLFVSLLLTSLPVSLDLLEVIKLWIAISSGALVLLYLATMHSTGPAAKRSVSELLSGGVSLPFYIGAVLVGLVVPIVLGGLSYVTTLPLPLVALIGVCSIVGGCHTIYRITRAGFYRPLTAL